MSTPLFPLAVWQSGTNENSIPANDNALRVEVLIRPAAGIADSEPPSPSDGDQYVVGDPWGGFTTDNVVIYKGGVWLEWEAFTGWVKCIDNDLYHFNGAAWVLGGGAGGGVPEAPVDGNTYGRRDADWQAISAGGESPVVILSGEAYTLGDLTPGAWHVLTSPNPVSISIEDEAVEPVPPNAEYGIECRGGGGASISASGAAVIIPPKGGELEMEQSDFAVLKRTAADEFKLVGSTVAA